MKLLKELLRSPLGKTHLDVEEMRTILGVINIRPISYVIEAVDDLQALTPGCLYRILKGQVYLTDKVDAV